MKQKRNRRKQTLTFDQRLQQAAEAAREEARKLPLGRERDLLLKKARQSEIAAHMNEWLASPGLQPPK